MKLCWRSSISGFITSSGHEKGFITNPKGKAKSIVFTEEGLPESERLFWEMFGNRNRGRYRH
jgi:hypothetical protein